MPRLILSTALLLTACSSSNPLFGLDPTDASGETTAAAATGDATTTATPTSQGPTTDPTAEPTTEATSTASPSEPLTSGTGLQDTTGVDPGTTGQSTSDDDTGNTSTGEMFCELYKDPDFHDILHVEGQPLAKCINEVTYFHGKLVTGDGVLRFDTTDTPDCNSEENYGVLSLGAGYSISVPNEGKCAKLYVYRDGDGPDCDIAQFFVLQADPAMPIAIGAFTPAEPVQNPPATLVLPEPELLPCCPAESQGCCEDAMFGDYALHVDDVTVLPGATEDITVNGQPGRLINIQNWQASECLENKLVGRRDFVAIRL